MHYYYSEHGLSLFCERVLDSFCSLVSTVSHIFFIFKKGHGCDTHAEVFEKC